VAKLLKRADPIQFPKSANHRAGGCGASCTNRAAVTSAGNTPSPAAAIESTKVSTSSTPTETGQ
jgi:hypothetical protein